MKGNKRKWLILAVAAQAALGVAVATGRVPKPVGDLVNEVLRALVAHPEAAPPEADKPSDL